MFEVPGSDIKGVHITEDTVLGNSPAIYLHRSNSTSSTDPPDASNTSEEEESQKYRVKQ
jgi:ATP-dependent Clp protease ATP-binding subunit ClpX